MPAIQGSAPAGGGASGGLTEPEVETIVTDALEVESWTDLGDLGATETISGAANKIRRREGTANQAVAVTIDLEDDQQVDLVVHQDGTGGRAITFSGVDAWVTDTPVTSFRGAAAVDRFRFEQVDGVTFGYWVTAPAVVDIMLAVTDETTAITTGTGKLTYRMPHAMYQTRVPRLNVNTVSSSGVVQADINEGGTTIFSTEPTIDANEKTSTTAATPAVLSDPVLADDAEITVDIVAAGTGAKGLKVTLTGYRL